MKQKVNSEEQLGIFVHQLKHRISKIKDYLSLIKEGEFGSLKKDLKKHMGMAVKYLQDISILIDEIGELLKYQMHGTPLFKEKTDIRKLIFSVIKELREDAKAKHITLQYLPTTLVPKLTVNYELIKALITNIVENAILYSESGAIRIGLKRKLKTAIIQVQDSGVGFSKSEAPKLFKRFSRTAISRALHPHGLGLGLYVAHMIMRAHGGKLWAHSEGLGKGATFFIELPLQ